MTRVMAEPDTRTKILEAALALFRERGFAEATMREIATRAGVASGLAYYYFDSKDAIVLAFYQRAQEELAPRMEAAQAGKTHGHELDPKEARRKVEVAWAYAKAHGEPAGEHVHVREWP